MSDVKFTPGPWIDVSAFGNVVKEFGEYPLPIDDSRLDGESWLDMRKRTKAAREARDQEAGANRQLQIAAPELYGKLEMLHSYLLEDDPHYAESQEFNEVETLMARARGEQP